MNKKLFLLVPFFISYLSAAEFSGAAPACAAPTNSNASNLAIIEVPDQPHNPQETLFKSETADLEGLEHWVREEEAKGLPFIVARIVEGSRDLRINYRRTKYESAQQLAENVAYHGLREGFLPSDQTRPIFTAPCSERPIVDTLYYALDSWDSKKLDWCPGLTISTLFLYGKPHKKVVDNDFRYYCELGKQLINSSRLLNYQSQQNLVRGRAFFFYVARYAQSPELIVLANKYFQDSLQILAPDKPGKRNVELITSNPAAPLIVMNSDEEANDESNDDIPQLPSSQRDVSCFMDIDEDAAAVDDLQLPRNRRRITYEEEK